MSTFVEKYMGWLLVPIGAALGIVCFRTGAIAMTFVSCLSIVFLVNLIQVAWRYVLVLQLNNLGYTVEKSSDGDWSASNPGQGIGARSLTDLVRSADEIRIRQDERTRVKRELKNWVTP